ncbi:MULTISPECIES: TrkA C-terminal domain-containing protein [Halorussus]|uniref:TrkA C-terminal domain-containing protein n=1 Tax=Halorussus TaxID=1070314 RepID=UPI000E20D111|nr:MULTISPECIES: TrkA C-terminal domain-containing protein [Halorussus]NHN59922.1 potassium transporter TrkA [Halorussus sp. JP-T4]
MNLLAALERPAVAVGRVLGLTLLAGGAATLASLLYRSYAREEMPEGLAVLVGLGVVGAWLNTTTALRQFLSAGRVVPSTGTVAVTVAAFVLGAGAASVGARSGAHLLAGVVGVDADVSRFVGSVGRFVTVELPDEIEEIDGYEPLDAETAESLAGKTLRFPRGLTVAELRERLVERLRDDYGVAHVDVELADDGTVAYLAAGGRAAGIGPTLAPGTVAVAVRADPAFSAGAGDVVQVWRETPPAGSGDEEGGGDEHPADESPSSESASAESPDSDPQRIATAELRATAGDVVTLALDAADAARLDPGAEYRLVTLPTQPRADREFSARLRAADETVGAVSLSADSPLVGAPVGSIDATVVAVRGADGVETIPPTDRLLGAGDTLYVVARPELLRKVEAAAGGGTEPVVAE